MKKIISCFHSEKEIQAQIIAYLWGLQRHGVLQFWRQNSGVAEYQTQGRVRRVKYGISGMPDICGYMRDGRALFIEVKRHDGKTTLLQKNFLQNAHDMGCVCVVARSVNDVHIKLKEFGYCV